MQTNHSFHTGSARAGSGARVRAAHVFAVLWVALCLAFPARLAAQAERASVLVHLAPGADRGPVRAFAAVQGAFVRYEYQVLPNVVNLRGIPAPAIAALENIPGVQRVEEDRVVQAHLDESTALINALQSDFNGTAFEGTNGAGVRVCVIDTGIDSDHTAYANRIDAAAGYDFVNDDNNPEDDNGHGAHVAGVALGALSSYPGVAPGATLIGVKVLAANGSGTFSDVIAGIDHCAGPANADVINLSLGGGSFSGSCDSDTAAQAANNAVDAGVVVVASSGNSGSSNAMGTPACGSKVIAVGATYDEARGSVTWCLKVNPIGLCTETCTDNTAVDLVTCFSNKSEELDVTAPGCFTTSAKHSDSNGGVIDYCGTSQASPHVAGLAALLLDHDPSLTPAQVRQLIRDGAVDKGPAGFDPAYGWGRIDAVGSLSLVGPGDPVTDVAIMSVSAPSSAVEGDTVSVDVTVKNIGNQDVSSSFNVALEDGGTPIGAQAVSSLTAGASTTITFSWDTTGASLGDHTLTASHDFGDDDATNDSSNTTVNVQDPLTDVAITSVSAPASVTEGSTVSVSVTVENVGNQDVGGFNVSLTDTDATASVLIGEQTVSGLVAGGSTTLTFSWSTTGASIGNHTLTASHSLAGDENSANDSGSTTVEVTEASSIALSVTGEKVRGTKIANLSWSPADTSQTVTITRDGNVITSTEPDDGSYTDTIGKGGGTHTYQVCVNGGGCSNEASWSF